MESSEWTDRCGSLASTICAIHCAICAFLPAALSALGLGFLLGQDAEWVFSIIAIGFGLVALFLGWRQHRSKQVAGLLILGVIGIMASRGLEMGSDHHGHGDEHHEPQADADKGEAHGSEEHHDDRGKAEASHDDDHGEHEDGAHLAGAVVGVLGGLILLVGHILNIRAARRCREEGCA